MNNSNKCQVSNYRMQPKRESLEIIRHNKITIGNSVMLNDDNIADFEIEMSTETQLGSRCVTSLYIVWLYSVFQPGSNSDTLRRLQTATLRAILFYNTSRSVDSRGHEST